MARKPQTDPTNRFGDGAPKPKPRTNQSNIKQWLSPYIDKADLDWLESNVDSMPEYVFGFLSELPVGYTLSSKFDPTSDRWLTTCICSAGDDPNEGIALTARGASRIDSLYTLAYLAAGKLEWNWTAQSLGGSGRFG